MIRTILIVSVVATLLGVCAASVPQLQTSQKQAHQFGLFIAANDQQLQFAHDAGFDTVISYDLLQQAPQDIQAHLDRAKQLGLKVIINLESFWPEVDSGAEVQAAFRRNFGGTFDDWASQATERYQAHPAVWGFNITDELPEAPETIGTWPTRLARRAELVRAHTTKPVMATLIGWSEDDQQTRRTFLSAVKPAVDALALDYYPIPEQSQPGPISRISLIAQDLAAVNQGQGWFVTQAFSWTDSQWARPQGESMHMPPHSAAPTAAQMVQMAKLAIDNGAPNVLFYSLVDAQATPGQPEQIRQAMQQLRQLYPQ